MNYVSAIDTFESSTYLYGTLGPARPDPQHNFVIQVQQMLSLPGGYFEATRCSVSLMALPDCLPCLDAVEQGGYACSVYTMRMDCIGDK